jgi:hypothetical protein
MIFSVFKESGSQKKQPQLESAFRSKSVGMEIQAKHPPTLSLSKKHQPTTQFKIQMRHTP